jgi:hypothetical protein
LKNYNEILNADWKSEKGKTKRVGPAATAKVLHLVAPDLFMIWDRKIRNDYGFQDSTKEYVRFLFNMQNWIRKLSSVLEKMQDFIEAEATQARWDKYDREAALEEND